MSPETSRIATDIDYDKPGKQVSYLRVPSSTDESAYGSVLLPITVIGGGRGPTILMTGGVHGDEYEGPIVLSELAKALRPDRLQGRAIIMPVLNRPAFDVGRRLSPIDGKNLNREFPGERDGTITSMIAHYVAQIVMPLADYVLDLHSGGRTLEYLPLAGIHVTGQAARDGKALDMLKAFDAPISLTSFELDAVGLFDTVAEAAGKINVSTELGGAGRVSPAGLDVARVGVGNVLKHLDMVEGKPVSLAERGLPATRFMDSPTGDYYPMAGDAGIYEPLFELGAAVDASAIIGRVHFLTQSGREPAPVTTKVAGTIIAVRPMAPVRAGDCVACLAIDLRR